MVDLDFDMDPEVSCMECSGDAGTVSTCLRCSLCKEPLCIEPACITMHHSFCKGPIEAILMRN